MVVVVVVGVNRVSVGVQSFDAGLLKACGRAHRYCREEEKGEGRDNYWLITICIIVGPRFKHQCPLVLRLVPSTIHLLTWPRGLYPRVVSVCALVWRTCTVLSRH